MKVRVLYASSRVWAGIGNKLDEVVDGPDFRTIKRTQRTVAGIARIDNLEVFVKRVRSGNWSRGIVARLAGSRGRRALRGTRLLQRTGFAHPKILAVFEKLHLGAVDTSYLITEALRRPRIPSRLALADGRDFNWRRWFSERLAQNIRRLHEAGCYTRDLQETNLMVETDGRELTVYFLDLEDFRWRRSVPAALRMRNLVHLDRSIGRFLSRAQRLRFLYQYLGGKPGGVEARRIVEQVHQVRAASERRKQRNRHSGAIVTPVSDAVAAEAKSPFR
jgi:tRNA A-37 threonylcarbamoyl transferase component Bud32